MNVDKVRTILREECEKSGSQRAWAEPRGMSPQYVSDVLAGRKEPGALILDALGLERVVTYRRARNV